MILQTNRLDLHLRELSFADIHPIHQLHSLAETDRYNTLGIPDTIDTTKQIVNEWIQAQHAMPRTSYVLCIEHAPTKAFIGLIALNLGNEKFRVAEVWYKIHVDHWKKGYTTQALQKLLDFAFMELKLHRIEAGCAVENLASIRVLEKAGMTKEGRKRKVLPIRGEWKDNFIYAILEEDHELLFTGRTG